ncbi:unnamed protein product [Heligmosomoides polygyrus]|uniref:TYR_PHOSPHATASE_2 domain-containing protein n=1 Tax=Heligmosomoides polygyrus TaxID=6339 RepID=A0A183G996_HELPZ|nr:unnamed protein product [Heligmosomoides polygyrus]
MSSVQFNPYSILVHNSCPPLLYQRSCRWLNYDPVGRDLEGTRFVPFKTPLDRSFFNGKFELTEDDHFDVERIVALARRAGKNIGMVVDLTNTDRYYNKAEWADHDIRYVKMNCPGHEVSEREDIVKKFMNVVDDFIGDSSNDDKLIGVHCTHGLNRTGYLICRYLIDRMGWKADRAISCRSLSSVLLRFCLHSSFFFFWPLFNVLASMS